jgi:hypothetical protein
MNATLQRRGWSFWEALILLCKLCELQAVCLQVQALSHEVTDRA